ncbi:MAG: hypothetical protein M1837_005576 [Sclerophora amabilis]|nr:MAG: hypothetical protein M1837_005576 [Sclerophora amabilis]
MGVRQSSESKGGGREQQTKYAGPEMKTCYYELLGVDRQASEDEIKKAYRRKALELHPDRNYGNVEHATRLFAEIQAANEVLSDPQERAWYDSHREAILRDEDEGSGEHYEHNVRVTTADDIMKMFTKFNGRMDFSDSSKGFFAVFRDTFESLANEESVACDWEGLDAVDYPSFGRADDTYEDVVRPFYAAWNGFGTRKTFSWKDIYRYSEAPDRRVRRMMEKENKRLREEGIREFNDAVRSLVAFVRKRDPRYVPNTQSEADRQKILRDAAAAQAARQRAANQARMKQHVVPEWTKAPESSPDLYEENEQDEASEEEHYECVACRKTFKSEKQFEAHEKSKKHVKAIQQLKRKMQKDNKTLDLDGISSSGVGTPGSLDQDSVDGDVEDVEHDAEGNTSASSKDLPSSVDVAKGSLSEPDETNNTANGSHIKEAIEKQGEASLSSSDSNDEYAPRTAVEGRISELQPDDDTKSTSSGGQNVANDVDRLGGDLATAAVNDDKTEVPRPKLGKAKEKRAKKAATQQQAANTSGPIAIKCAACNESFTSKTKLFGHIKEFGHAQPVMKSTKTKKR